MEVTTEIFGARASAFQVVAWSLGALSALIALVLVSLRARFRECAARVRAWPRAIVGPLGVPDLVVVALLSVWWIVGPALYDDGWVKTRQTNYEVSGGFSNYHTAFGTNLPLDYWVEWVQHWIIARWEQMLVLRVPALVCLAAIWILCRWTFSQIANETGRSDRTGTWTLAAAFLAGAMAWDMTLRPEPAVAILVAIVLAAAIRFRLRPGAAPLAVSAVAFVLSLTAHPAGIVTLAPLLAIATDIVRWARGTRWTHSATLVASASAFLVILVSVGADVFQRGHEARMIRTFGDATASWREELNRYGLLFSNEYGSALRRLSVVLLVLAVVWYLTRRRSHSSRLLDVPAASVAISLLLLVTTPSKWSWHFGVFAGIGAVAVATEILRLRSERSPGSWVRQILAWGAVVIGIAWAWEPRLPWAYLDLRTLNWRLEIESRILLWRPAAFVLVLVLALVTVRVLLDRSSSRLSDVPRESVPWLVPAAVFPLIGFTIGVLIADAAKTPAWTLTRQNFETIRGKTNCGLADDTTVTHVGSIRQQPIARRARTSAGTASGAIQSPKPGLAMYPLGPRGGKWAARTHWHVVAPDRRVGFYISTTHESSGEHVHVRWGKLNPRGTVKLLGKGEAAVSGFGVTGNQFGQWWFVAQGALPPRPMDANVMQVVVSREASAPEAAVSSVVSYRTGSLASILRAPGATALIEPNLVTYLPCASQPRLSQGTIDPPTLVISRGWSWLLGRGVSPFDGTLDLYALEHAPVLDSALPPDELTIVMVDQRIPGALVAPAMRTSA